jgi:acyl transferase domain-containing protein/acyl carrier protein
MSEPQPNSSETVAIIGMAGRFPRAKTVAEFWDNLCNGVDAISFFTRDEMLAAGVDAALIDNPHYVPAKGLLDDIEMFDASFFGFSPREAEVLDPQHRIFLECTWEALEAAGYDPEQYAGAIGVYAGVSMNTYLINNLLANPDTLSSVGGYQVMLGNDKDFIPTRVSYKLNLRGPSMNIQTACSTSLVAVQTAFQSLLSYQCDMALAGGVAVSLPHQAGYLYQEGMILSPDGHCRAFDAAGQGIVAGEGVGIVVLKRLADALADHDHIHAVIRGASINNDGSLKVGYTAPSVDGQAEAIAMAQWLAQITPDTIGYVETHGTGTALGDPIEVSALTQAFRLGTDRKGFCPIGSVKTNIGHLDAAAGIAGLIKTALALEHKQIPPSLHFKRPNPNIDFANSPFYVNTALADWPAGPSPRRAGVSSFGIGGTNAHAVLEEAPEAKPSQAVRSAQLLVLSAKSEAALDTAGRNLAVHLRRHPELTLADVAYTLQVGRRAFDHRRTLVCAGTAEAVTALEAENAPRAVLSGGARPNVAFMFTGQGAQYPQMGAELYHQEPAFRAMVDECAVYLAPYLGLDLRTLLFPDAAGTESAARQLQQTWLTQPALFVSEYPTDRLLMSWGIEPQAMIGHSIGEYVAACLADVFSLTDALRLVATRGRLMQELPPGAMLSVPLPEAEVRTRLAPDLSLAVVNGTALCVVAGPSAAIDALAAQLEAVGTACQRLHTSHAFHSAMMEPVLATFTAAVAEVERHTPALPFISNVSGTWITAAEATDPHYWARHLRQTVLFAQGLETLLQDPARILLEVGPGQTLTSLARRHPARRPEQAVFSTLRHPQNTQSDVAFLLNTTGQLWSAGIKIDWEGFHRGTRQQRVPLPTNPFERQRCWVERQYGPQANRAARLPEQPDTMYYLPTWKQAIAREPLESLLAEKAKARWLFFGHADHISGEIMDLLRGAGDEVIAVAAGAAFEVRAEDEYAINPRVADDYRLLIRRLCANGKLPDRIVHVWALTEPTWDTPATPLELGFYSLIWLAQAIGDEVPSVPIMIDVLSRGMHDISGEETLDPIQATLLGPCKTIPIEYSNLNCRSIDVALPQPGSRAERELARRVVAELLSAPSARVVAYRGRHRWVQALEPSYLPDHPNRPRLREKGVYLITGGLGGIGLVLADYLARQVQARLAFTTRSTFPGATAWATWLADHDDDDSTSRKIRTLQALEAQGATVSVLQADATDRDQMQQAIALVEQQWGQINGVIHAAGLPGGGMIQLKTWQAADEVLAPKVQGTLILHDLLQHQPLDFFLLCSSINSLLPVAGQADYCAANAFLDAFAHWRNRQAGVGCVSVEWDTWREVGMAVNVQVPTLAQAQKEANLRQGLLSADGQRAFAAVLASAIEQVLVTKRPVMTQATYEENAAAMRAGDGQQNAAAHPGAAPTTALHARPGLSTAYAAPRNEHEVNVIAIWQALLGIDQIGIHDNFFELGGHSLLATQVISRLRDMYQVDLPLRSLFEATTPAELAERLQVILWAAGGKSVSSPTDAGEREEFEL